MLPMVWCLVVKVPYRMIPAAAQRLPNTCALPDDLARFNRLLTSSEAIRAQPQQAAGNAPAIPQ